MIVSISIWFEAAPAEFSCKYFSVLVLMLMISAPLPLMFDMKLIASGDQDSFPAAVLSIDLCTWSLITGNISSRWMVPEALAAMKPFLIDCRCLRQLTA